MTDEPAPTVGQAAEAALEEVEAFVGQAFIERGTPAFLRANLALFAAGFSTFGLLYCVQPLLPVFSAVFGISAASSSLSLSLTTGMLAVSMLPAAVASEAWGRKPVMVASLLLSAVLTLVTAALPHWAELLALRAALGITISGLPAVAMAYVAEEMHPKSIGLAMGLYVGGTGLGGLAGRLLTGVVTDLAGWRAALALLGVLGLGSGALFALSLPPSRHFRARASTVGMPALRTLPATFGAHLRNPTLPWLFFVGFAAMGGFVTAYNFIGYRLLGPPFGLSQTAVGLIFTVYLAGIAASAFVGDLAGRLGRARVLPACLGLMLAGTALTAVPALPVIIGGVAVLTVGFFGTHSVASASVGAQARQAKAQASSLYLFAYYMGSSLVGSLGGAFWDRAGWPGVIGLTGTVLAAGLLASLRLALRG